MPEEFVCEECAYTSIDDGNCPFCGSRMIKLDDDFDKDLADTDDEKYDPKTMTDDDDMDLVEEPAKRKKPMISEDLDLAA